jgi:hypothetical protein
MRNMSCISAEPSRWLLILLLLAFFGPYYPGTPFRLDQIIGWLYILLFISLLFAPRAPFRAGIQAKLAAWALIILAMALLRLFCYFDNLRAAFQIANQFSYFAAGMALFLVHETAWRRHRRLVVSWVLWATIALNAFALLQLLHPEHPLVQGVLDWYGGVSSEEFGNFGTMAALSVLGARQATSIFVGAQGLAIWNLMGIALASGALADTQARARGLAMVAIAMSLIGGALAGSKTFLFGLLILFALLGFSSGAMRSGRLIFFLLVSVLFLGIYKYFADELPVTGDVWNLLVEFRWLNALSSRFGSAGSEGYLTDVMYKTFEPFTLLFGLGSSAVDYKYTDFQFRQVVLVGGLPLFIVYYGFLLYLLSINWRARRTVAYGLPLFSLGVAFLITGIAMDTHLQARTIPIWILLNLLLSVPASQSHPAGNDEPTSRIQPRCRSDGF